MCLETLDNAVALGALIKGSSGAPLVDRAAMIAAVASASLRTRVWYEYIESESNWSDSASRVLGLCPFCRKHGFELVEFPRFPTWPWLSTGDAFLDTVDLDIRTALGE